MSTEPVDQLLEGRDQSATSQPETAATKARGQLQRLRRALGPVAIGMVIDGIDFFTLGPAGISAGLVLGGLAGYLLGREIGLSGMKSVLVGVVSGLYCMLPPTSFLPLGTLAGALGRYLVEPRRDS